MAGNEVGKVSPADWLRWFVAAGFFVGGMALYYGGWLNTPLLRGSACAALLICGAVFAGLTAHGRRLVSFAQASRNELRKVVWPTRQETLQATLLVLGMVLVVGLLLWVADSVLLRLVAWLTGHGSV